MWKLWILFLFFVAADAGFMDALRPKTVRIYKFEGVCKGYENATIQLKNIRLTYANKVHVISLRVVAKDPITDDLKIRLDIQRCKSREALDSCEKYQTIRINHLCNILSAENKPWSPLVKMSDPPMGCPIKKGVRVVNNGTFDGDAFSHLPIAGWYWIITAWVLGQDTDLVHLCVKFEGQLVSS